MALASPVPVTNQRLQTLSRVQQCRHSSPEEHLRSDDVIPANQTGPIVWAYPTSYLVEFVEFDDEGVYQTSRIGEYVFDDLEFKTDCT